MQTLYDIQATPINAQVPVGTSARKNIATAIDILCMRNNQPLVVELKYAGATREAFMAASMGIDPVNPRMHSTHLNHKIPRTQHNIYMDQLHANMALYARQTKYKPNTVVHGLLLVACQNNCHLVHTSFPYIPNTGINTPVPPSTNLYTKNTSPYITRHV
jgi:hypothetical protein